MNWVNDAFSATLKDSALKSRLDGKSGAFELFLAKQFDRSSAAAAAERSLAATQCALQEFAEASARQQLEIHEQIEDNRAKRAAFVQSAIEVTEALRQETDSEELASATPGRLIRLWGYAKKIQELISTHAFDDPITIRSVMESSRRIEQSLIDAGVGAQGNVAQAIENRIAVTSELISEITQTCKLMVMLEYFPEFEGKMSLESTANFLAAKANGAKELPSYVGKISALLVPAIEGGLIRQNESGHPVFSDMFSIHDGSGQVDIIEGVGVAAFRHNVDDGPHQRVLQMAVDADAKEVTRLQHKTLKAIEAWRDKFNAERKKQVELLETFKDYPDKAADRIKLRPVEFTDWSVTKGLKPKSFWSGWEDLNHPLHAIAFVSLLVVGFPIFLLCLFLLHPKETWVAVIFGLPLIASTIGFFPLQAAYMRWLGRRAVRIGREALDSLRL